MMHPLVVCERTCISDLEVTRTWNFREYWHTERTSVARFREGLILNMYASGWPEMIASYLDIAGREAKLGAMWIYLTARYSMTWGLVFLTGEPQAETSPWKHWNNEIFVVWLVERGYLVLFHLLSLGTSYRNGAAKGHLRSAGPSHCKTVVCVILRVGEQTSAFASASQRLVADSV